MTNQNQEAARSVVAKKSSVNETIDVLLSHQANKLAERGPQRLALFRLEMQLVDDLKRLYTIAKRIAKSELPAELLEAKAA